MHCGGGRVLRACRCLRRRRASSPFAVSSMFIPASWQLRPLPTFIGNRSPLNAPALQPGGRGPRRARWGRARARGQALRPGSPQRRCVRPASTHSAPAGLPLACAAARHAPVTQELAVYTVKRAIIAASKLRRNETGGPSRERLLLDVRTSACSSLLPWAAPWGSHNTFQAIS